MELSCGTEGGVATTSIHQQPPATIIYSSKEMGWQPIVTPLPIIPSRTAEIPKESIIANTDFTTTSVIAKRRLSSRKKRRQQDSTDCAPPTRHTPPPLTTAVYVPHPADDHKLSSQVPSVFPPTSSSPSTTATIGHAPQHIHTVQQGGVVGTTPLVSNGSSQYIPIGALPQHNQLNQVIGQLPPELVYRVLQQEHCPPSIITSSGPASIMTSSGPVPASIITSSGPVPAPQQLQYVESSTGQHLGYPPAPVQTSLSPPTQQVVEGQELIGQQLQQYHHQLQLQHLQQQQALAMMQLYGGVQTGLYSAAPQLHLQGGVPIVGHASHSNQLIGVPVQTVYASQQHHSIPIATALAPPELLVQVQNGSWVAPTATPMFGSCIVNPIQPGLLATSLVK